MLKAILFDLDGTMLPLDIESFVKDYFKKLAEYFHEIINPEIFIKGLLLATEKMITNQGKLANEEMFMQKFLPLINQERSKMEPLFMQFYQEEFPKLSIHAHKNLIADEIVKTVIKKGYKIVLATNPLFPEAAILERMNWAGIADNPWELITSYEKFHSSKPSISYFREIATKIQVLPEECLMVGNDMQEDMIASEIGMKTFLVTDYLVDKGNEQYRVNQAGSLVEVKKYLSSLPKIKEGGGKIV